MLLCTAKEVYFEQTYLICFAYKRGMPPINLKEFAVPSNLEGWVCCFLAVLCHWESFTITLP